MYRIKFGTVLLVALLAACAQVPTQPGGDKPVLSASEAQTAYQRGLTHYRENRFDAARTDLSAAATSGHLKAAELTNARKHLAFIHCGNGSELACREQFQAILKADPKFDLAPNEANHPLWGPVWRSAKGIPAEKPAVSRTSSTTNTNSTETPAQQKLAEGIREYEAGHYSESLTALKASIKQGLLDKSDELRAHKYTAFVYCLTQRTRQCRAEFRRLFAKNPRFELLRDEARHPAWAAVYRSEKKAAAKKAAFARKGMRK
jgi:hypothetical protein